MADETRTEIVKRIQERIARNQYDVDPARVAEAIVARLADGGTLGDRDAGTR